VNVDAKQRFFAILLLIMIAILITMSI